MIDKLLYNLFIRKTTSMIINCEKLALNIQKANEIKFKNLHEIGIIPRIVILYPCQTEACDIYLRQKLKVAKILGVECEIETNFPNQEALINRMKQLNIDPLIHGYIIQLPLNKKFNFPELSQYISPQKDLDGLSYASVINHYYGSEKYYPYPCTPKAILKVLASKHINLNHKNVVIINRSYLVGKPLMDLLINENATVTMCHSYTKHIKEHCQNADIIISAIGKPHILTKKYFKSHNFVIDVGISSKHGKICGDVKTDEVAQIARHITPVPKGIGLLTVQMLFDNLFELIQHYVLSKK